MTEDELREEATSTIEWEAVPMIDRPLFVFAYVKGAEPREKWIAELEKSIQKKKFIIDQFILQEVNHD